LDLSKVSKIEKWAPKLITKSGPGVVSAPNKGSEKIMPIVNMYDTTAAMLVQAIQLVKNPKFSGLFLAFKDLAFVTGQDSLVTKITKLAGEANQIPEIFQRSVSVTSRIDRKRVTSKKVYSFLPPYLGRLGAKEEPGKVRVFAMVDW